MISVVPLTCVQSGQGSGPGRKLKDSSVAFGGGGSSSLIQEVSNHPHPLFLISTLFCFVQIALTPPFTGPRLPCNIPFTQTVVTVWRTYACLDDSIKVKSFFFPNCVESLGQFTQIFFFSYYFPYN